MCGCLKVSRSGYYAWCKREPGKRELANAALDESILTVFNQHEARFGAIRVTKDLHGMGIVCTKNRVARRMNLLKIRAKGKRKFKATTDSAHVKPTFENLLNREFRAEAPNQKWVSDITYVWTQEGWLYLCVFIDLYSRAVIGWSMGNRIDSNLVCNALMMALWRRGFPKGVLVHSDRGSQYASRKYLALLKTYQLIGSMSRKGNCWDNACAESFFHTIKIELINDILYLSREEAKQSIFEYVEMYYNKRRRHSTIDYNTPEEFEKLNYSLRKIAVH